MPPRIVTLTVNPALDVAMEAAELRPGHKIRAHSETYDPGGGGINVSRVVHALGGETLAIFAKAGLSGHFVEEMLTEAGVSCRPFEVAGTSRISVTVHETSTGSEYRFVPEGPKLGSSDADGLLGLLGDLRADWLVASGSLSVGLPVDFYGQVAKLAHRQGIRFALDTSGAPLKAALHKGIDLLKTSLSEFQSITGANTFDRASLAEEASRMVAAGAASAIALTLGEDGAVLCDGDRQLMAPAIAVKRCSSVGAGDSFLAGLVLGMARGDSHDDALRLAIATSGAAIVSQGTARVNLAQVNAFLAQAVEAR